MSKQPDETSVVRQWIDKQRVDIANQIAALRGKLSVFDQMEKELGKVISHEQPQHASKGRGARSTAQATALLALEAAGPNGLTSTELAEVAHMPKGTASGRLSLMKQDGLVKKVDSRYFAVHSTQEDNNTEQGGYNGR
jgi:hypothetical protein